MKTLIILLITLVTLQANSITFYDDGLGLTVTKSRFEATFEQTEFQVKHKYWNTDYTEKSLSVGFKVNKSLTVGATESRLKSRAYVPHGCFINPQGKLLSEIKVSKRKFQGFLRISKGRFSAEFSVGFKVSYKISQRISLKISKSNFGHLSVGLKLDFKLISKTA